MGSVWCYRNWIELVGIKMTPNYPVNLRWRVIYWLVTGFRVVDVARILHVWQTFVKKIRHFFRIKYPLGGLLYAADGKLAFNLVNEVWSNDSCFFWPENSKRHVIRQEYNLVDEDENSGADRIMISVPSINPFVKKMGLTSKRYVCLVAFFCFLLWTLLILIIYHLRNEMKNKASAYDAFLNVCCWTFENVNIYLNAVTW